MASTSPKSKMESIFPSGINLTFHEADALYAIRTTLGLFEHLVSIDGQESENWDQGIDQILLNLQEWKDAQRKDQESKDKIKANPNLPNYSSLSDEDIQRKKEEIRELAMIYLGDFGMEITSHL